MTPSTPTAPAPELGMRQFFSFATTTTRPRQHGQHVMLSFRDKKHRQKITLQSKWCSRKEYRQIAINSNCLAWKTWSVVAAVLLRAQLYPALPPPPKVLQGNIYYELYNPFEDLTIPRISALPSVPLPGLNGKILFFIHYGLSWYRIVICKYTNLDMGFGT